MRRLKHFCLAALAKLGYELHPTRGLYRLTWDQLHQVEQYRRHLLAVGSAEGEIVECGVGYGQGLLRWLMAMEAIGRPRCLHGYDTFQGFPVAGPYDARPGATHRFYDPGGPDAVRMKLEQVGVPPDLLYYLTLRPGLFHDTLTSVLQGPIAILSLDCDLYESYCVALNILAPKVIPTGRILIDEYKQPDALRKWPGASKAVDEWRAQHPEWRLTIEPDTGRAWMTRAMHGDSPSGY